MQPIRQGDVWLYPIEDEHELAELPGIRSHGFNRWRDVRLDPNDADVLLALGEVTGHAHRIKHSSRKVRFREATTFTGRVIVNGAGRRRILQVRHEPALLTHEEHETLTIPPGDYEVRIQREYEPGPAKTFRYVAD